MTIKAMLLLQKRICKCKTYIAMLSPMVDTACISTSTKTHDQANPFTPNSGQNENLRKILNLIL